MIKLDENGRGESEIASTPSFQPRVACVEYISSVSQGVTIRIVLDVFAVSFRKVGLTDTFTSKWNPGCLVIVGDNHYVQITFVVVFDFNQSAPAKVWNFILS